MFNHNKMIETTSVPDCLQFKKIAYKKLVHEHKYIMQMTKDTLYVGFFENKEKYRNRKCKSFIITKRITGYVYVEIEIDIYTDMERLSYYEICLKKHKIQDAMELRAVNKILQKIIGDDTFVY